MFGYGAVGKVTVLPVLYRNDETPISYVLSALQKMQEMMRKCGCYKSVSIF